MIKTLAILFAFLTIAASTQSQTPRASKPVVIGYVGGYRGLVNTDVIDVKKLTHINYAFVDVQNNRAWLTNEKTDTVNFRKLNLLKQQNPDLKILISIGGWSWSENFSNAVLTDTSRRAFAISSVAIMKKHNLDGVDIDWEYPGMKGEEGNVYRPEDKQNYTLMFQAIREELTKLQQETGRYYLLTTATAGSPKFLEHTEMGKAQEYLDYVNLMTYDFSYGAAGHHTNLYPSVDYDKENSAHKSVTTYMAAGVPAHKLVVGLAFYGRGGIVEKTDNRGLNQKISGAFRVGGYSYIKDSLLTRKGFKVYWDKKAKAPYLFNEAEKKFASFDNERSVKYKCQYVNKYKLGGVMFWEYSSDPKLYLLNAIKF
jgi:chitinase